MKNENNIINFKLLLISNVLLAQENIRGQVFSKSNDNLVPISGVNIYWLDTSVGTISNEDGKFSIPIITIQTNLS